MKNKEWMYRLPLRCAAVCVGLAVMAFGIAFSIKAGLGTSPISSAPYVLSLISGLSVGTTTILVNIGFVLLQILILRKRYDWVHLLQVPATFLFGAMIDLGSSALQGISYTGYWQQWLLCAVGIILVALGVSVEITAAWITTPGEGVVVAVCRVAPVKFGNMKVVFDVSLVCVSVVLSLCFLGGLEGVREGTVAAAVCVGLLTKLFRKPLRGLAAYLSPPAG